MKKESLYIIVLLLISCQNSTLKISDLKFSDPKQEYIDKNHIKKTYMISGSEPLVRGDIGDTIGSIEYDANGKIKRSSIKSFIYDIVKKYQYDTLHLETQKIFFTDFEAVYNFRYELDSENLILKKFYLEPSTDITEEQFLQPAGIFKFNENGYLTESLEYENNDEGRGMRILSKYNYDSMNLLTSKEVRYTESVSKDTVWLYKTLTKFYYTNNKPDSTSTIHTWIDRNKQKQNYTKKTFYDENGLMNREVTKGFFMDSLVTYYRHLK